MMKILYLNWDSNANLVEGVALGKLYDRTSEFYREVASFDTPPFADLIDFSNDEQLTGLCNAYYNHFNIGDEAAKRNIRSMCVGDVILFEEQDILVVIKPIGVDIIRQPK